MALKKRRVSSEVSQPNVVGTDQVSNWCLALFTPSMRLTTQK